MQKIYYATSIKIVSIFLFMFSIFAAYAASQARESQVLMAMGVALFFLSSSLFFLYQTFFVYFKYNNEALFFGKKEKKILWVDLVETGYSRWLDMNFIKFKDSKRIYISAYMESYDEFTDFLEEKTREIDEYYEEKIK